MSEINEREVYKASSMNTFNRCLKGRNFKAMLGKDLSVGEAFGLDRYVTGLDIIEGVLCNDFDISEVPSLVAEGMDLGYGDVPDETKKGQNLELTNKLIRYLKSEKREIYFDLERKEFERIIEVDGEKRTIYISSKPVAWCDYINSDGERVIELISYKFSKKKPTVKTRGRNLDSAAKKNIDLYFMIQYGKLLLDPGEAAIIRASYYHMTKDTDKAEKLYNSDFFYDDKGKIDSNIAYLEERWDYDGVMLGIRTELDKDFDEVIKEYLEGMSDCSEEACAKCNYYSACHYVKTPSPLEVEEKTLSNKKGKIIPSDAQAKVIAVRSGYVRVNATAGSGKTETVTERVAQMIAESLGC